MPLDFTLINNLVFAGEPFEPKPYFTGWNRVEGRVRLEDFERALRAEARDPLWFLTRQWQFLELKGDDAGSPIEARLATRQSKLERFATRDGQDRAFPTEAPLEAVVERETPPFDRVALIQIHRAFDKALLKAGVIDAEQRRRAHDWMRTQYPLDPAQLDGVDDWEAQQLAVLADSHLFDAKAFLAAANFAARVDAGLGSSQPALAPAVKAAGAETAAWYRALYLGPDSVADIAWVPSQLEYQFRCATAPGRGQTVLVGDSYTQGRLDWFCVDVAVPPTRPDRSRAVAPTPPETTLSFIPAAVNFAGMPSHRFWEMENSKVEFGALTAHTTDIGKLLLTEFMLAYGNDWCVIPFEGDIGALIDTLGLVVKDTFGQATLVRAADLGRDEDWRRWAMFGLETREVDDRAQPRLFLAPAAPKLMESAPIERVVFLRDEMANLCWAVERTVLSKAGKGIEAEHYAASIAPPPPVDPAPAPGATARYRLGTDAPLNWRPFVPAHIDNSQRSVRLQRARLPRDARPPLGKVIAEPAPYFIDEEAIPRAGVIVTRTFQRARWNDGRVVVWLGRRAMVGSGEGESRLEFDRLEEIPLRD